MSTPIKGPSCKLQSNYLHRKASSQLAIQEVEQPRLRSFIRLCTFRLSIIWTQILVKNLQKTILNSRLKEHYLGYFLFYHWFKYSPKSVTLFKSKFYLDRSTLVFNIDPYLNSLSLLGNQNYFWHPGHFWVFASCNICND